MSKYSLVIFAAVVLQAICGIIARPEKQPLSEHQITRLKEVASQWKEVINTQKKPCDDFYGYVCSNKDYPDSPGSTKILQGKIETTTETGEKFKKFSAQCEDIKEEDKDEFIKSFNFDSIGSWPAFEENWDDSKFNLPRAIAEMASYDYHVVLKEQFRDLPDTLETSYVISKKELIDVDVNKDLLKTKFESLGVRNPEEVLADAALFEKIFKEADESVKCEDDLTIKFSDLKDKYPEINWDQPFKVIYGEKLPEDYTVVIKSNNKLGSIYSAISKMSPKVVANYFFTVFVLNVHNLEQTPAPILFLPVVKESVLKSLENGNRKDTLKDLYMTIIEVLSQIYDFETHKISENLIKFINEDIFGTENEEDLSKEFKEITCDKGCMANYNLLQKLHKKRFSKHLFQTKNALVNEIKSDLLGHFFYAASNLIDEPLLFKFEPLMLAIVPTVLSPFMKEGIFTAKQKECFAKQVNKESVTDKELTMILGTHIILKIFADWSKDYQDIFEEENKIFQEYDLSVEQLLFVSIGKYLCNRPDSFNLLMGAFSTAVHCPAGSKWNTDTVCTLFPIQ